VTTESHCQDNRFFNRDCKWVPSKYISRAFSFVHPIQLSKTQTRLLCYVLCQRSVYIGHHPQMRPVSPFDEFAPFGGCQWWKPPLWSSGQSSWIQIQRSELDSRSYQVFWEVVGLEWGPLSLVSIIEELLGRNASGSGLESREYDTKPLYPQNLTLTSPTIGGRSVGIVRSQTQATEFVCLFVVFCMCEVFCCFALRDGRYTSNLIILPVIWGTENQNILAIQ
jgi:hypothetical protein